MNERTQGSVDTDFGDCRHIRAYRVSAKSWCMLFTGGLVGIAHHSSGNWRGGGALPYLEEEKHVVRRTL